MESVQLFYDGSDGDAGRIVLDIGDPSDEIDIDRDDSGHVVQCVFNQLCFFTAAYVLYTEFYELLFVGLVSR